MSSATLPMTEDAGRASAAGLQGLTGEDLANALFDAELQAQQERPFRRPGATYRLQMHKGFRFEDLERIVDYLHDLGITDCYLSPYLEARPGSTHGYDVVDHGHINPEIGDEQAHGRLVARLRDRGMGRLLDIVPNHMGIGTANRHWLDVLETGPQSPSARYFDIDWDPVKEELSGKVLLPLLEDFYGKVLESGLLELERDGGSFWVRYHDHRLPLNPRSYAKVLDRRAREFQARFDAEDEDTLTYLSIRDAARSLPPRDSSEPEHVEQVRREKEVIKLRIRHLCEHNPRMREFLDENVASFRGTAGDPSSFSDLHELLEEQVYRLAYWRVASEEINYRRFFDVTELAGVRTEDPAIFDRTHALIFRWIEEGGVTGLRIDHPDGLADPLGYFRRLQERLFLQACRRRLEAEEMGGEWEKVVGLLWVRYRAAVVDDPASPLARRFPVVVEKILSRGERLPADWPIDGTVGYEYLNALNGLFVDQNAAAEILETYREFTGDHEPFAEVLHRSKLLIEDVLLASELTMLTRQLNRVTEHDRLSRDFTHNDLRRVLREVIAGFRIYRTYLQPGAAPSPTDRKAIDQAVARARKRRPAIHESVFQFVRDALLMKMPEGVAPEVRAQWDQFAIRFQQTTGPVQAKGLEDTAFYRQTPLSSLNEVGGDPSRFGNSPWAFHTLNQHRIEHWPAGLSTSATHDTKRGEDTRIRIDVLSELPGEWRTRLARWSRWNARNRSGAGGRLVPDAAEEYLLYQSLIGTWPFGGPDDAPPEGYTERIQEYMLKAVREAKRNTSWTDPDPSYAEGVSRFVADVLKGPGAASFINDFLPFQRRIARVGVVHSLAQVLLKLASPGVADIYQGCELWDFSLVDPDNRRPVDYAERARLLAEIRRELDGRLPRAEVAGRRFAAPEDGAIKQYVVWSVLNHRRDNLPLYQQGSYRPLELAGDLHRHAVAILRRFEERSVLAVAPRLVAGLMGEDAGNAPLGRATWGETHLVLPDAAPARWRNLLTDEPVPVLERHDRRRIDLADAFRTIPIALLVEDEPA